MAESKSHKIAVMVFLVAIFVLLAVFTATWIYKMYTEQTALTERNTLATINCGKYYYSIDPRTVTYDNGTLYLELENTIGAGFDYVMLQSSMDKKEVKVSLTQGMIQPVSVPISLDTWVLVYPKGCEGINFKNLSFEPLV